MAEVKIKTLLDNSKLSSGLDEAISKIEKKISELQRKAEKQKLKIGVEESNIKATNSQLQQTQAELKGVKSELDDIAEDAQKLAMLRSKMESGEQLTDAEFFDYAALDMAGVGKTESELLSKMYDLESQEEKIKSKLKEQNVNLKEQKQIYAEIIKDIDTQNSKISQVKLDYIKTQVGSIGKSVKSNVKSVLKWGLAIFSVRSAYLFVRQTMSTISQYNKQLATDLEYIKFSIANALEPLIVKIVDLVYKLLTYVNYLTKAWFNIDLNDGAKKFKSMSKSAKEIKNSLAGFDEMNVMADTSTSGGGDAGGNLKDFNLKGEAPEWLEKVRVIGEWVLTHWLEVVNTLLLTKLVIDLLTGNWVGVIIDLIAFLGLNIPMLIKYVKIFLEELQAFWEKIKEWAKEKWDKVKEWVKEKWEKAKEWIKTTFSWDNIETFVATLPIEIEKWIRTIINKAFTLLGTVATWIYKNVILPIINYFKPFYDSIKQIVEGIVKIFKGDLKGGLTTVVKGIANLLISTINSLIKGINKITTPIRGMIVAIGKVLGKSYTMDNIKLPEIPKLAVGGVVNRPTYAMIGEAGREAVMPLDRNTQWMDELAKKINASGGVVNVYLDGRLIQRTISQREEELNFATNGGM